MRISVVVGANQTYRKEKERSKHVEASELPTYIEHLCTFRDTLIKQLSLYQTPLKTENSAPPFCNEMRSSKRNALTVS